MTTLENPSSIYEIQAYRKVLPDGGLQKFLARVSFHSEQVLVSKASTYVTGQSTLEEEFYPGFVPIQRELKLWPFSVYDRDRLKSTLLRGVVDKDDGPELFKFVQQTNLTTDEVALYSGYLPQVSTVGVERHRVLAGGVVVADYQRDDVTQELSLVIENQHSTEVIDKRSEKLEKIIAASDLGVLYPMLRIRKRLEVPFMKIPASVTPKERTDLLNRINNLTLMPHGLKLTLGPINWEIKV